MLVVDEHSSSEIVCFLDHLDLGACVASSSSPAGYIACSLGRSVSFQTEAEGWQYAIDSIADSVLGGVVRDVVVADFLVRNDAAAKLEPALDVGVRLPLDGVAVLHVHVVAAGDHFLLDEMDSMSSDFRNDSVNCWNI